MIDPFEAVADVPVAEMTSISKRGDGSSPILAVDDVHLYYGNIAAVKGISIEVYQGEIVSLIGANGAGKSTTMRADRKSVV